MCICQREVGLANLGSECRPSGTEGKLKDFPEPFGRPLVLFPSLDAPGLHISRDKAATHGHEVENSDLEGQGSGNAGERFVELR